MGLPGDASFERAVGSRICWVCFHLKKAIDGEIEMDRKYLDSRRSAQP